MVLYNRCIYRARPNKGIFLYKTATYPLLTFSLPGPYLLLLSALAMERKKNGQIKYQEGGKSIPALNF